MKKLAFLAMTLLLTVGLAHALLPSFGIKGGVNMAKFTGSDAGDNDYKIGAVGGAFACLDLIAFKVQPEILYSQKGAKYTILGATLYEKHDYVEIPVLLKFSFGKLIVPSIYAGPAAGLLMSAKLTNGGSLDIKDEIKGTDLGLVFGAEVKTPAKLSVDARYTMGMGTFDKEGDYTVKNSAISVMLGYYMF
jgi:hypothetical protein